MRKIDYLAIGILLILFALSISGYQFYQDSPRKPKPVPEVSPTDILLSELENYPNLDWKETIDSEHYPEPIQLAIEAWNDNYSNNQNDDLPLLGKGQENLSRIHSNIALRVYLFEGPLSDTKVRSSFVSHELRIICPSLKPYPTRPEIRSALSAYYDGLITLYYLEAINQDAKDYYMNDESKEINVEFDKLNAEIQTLASNMKEFEQVFAQR